MWNTVVIFLRSYFQKTSESDLYAEDIFCSISWIIRRVRIVTDCDCAEYSF